MTYRIKKYQVFGEYLTKIFKTERHFAKSKTEFLSTKQMLSKTTDDFCQNIFSSRFILIYRIQDIIPNLELVISQIPSKLQHLLKIYDYTLVLKCKICPIFLEKVFRFTKPVKIIMNNKLSDINTIQRNQENIEELCSKIFN